MTATITLLIVFGLVLLVFYGHYHFNTHTVKDKELLFNLNGNTEKLVIKEDIEHLPEIMKKYLFKVGVLGKCKDCHAIIKQSGQIQQKKDSKWMGFTAKQFMTAEPIGFVWAARAFPIFVKDKSVDGIGEMHVSFLGLKPIVVKQNLKTNESSLGRCLGELPLYPIGFLNKSIQWQIIDSNSVLAKIFQKNTSTEGKFHFNENGLIDRFETKRYRDEDLEGFTGKMENYQMKEGFLIPTKLRAIWNLKEGDFEYFNCDIIDYRIE